MPTIYLYILDTLADWEPGHVLAELRSGRYLKDPSLQYDVVLCGRTTQTIRTMGGLHLTPDVLISDIRPDTGDLILLPGADTWLDPAHASVIVKVREHINSEVTIAAICGSTLALANAGLLDQRPHTSNDPAVLKTFCPGYHGEKFYVDEPAVTDGHLITASGLAPVEFAYQVFRKLDVMTPETLEAWHGLFKTRKPEFFYALMESLPKNPGSARPTGA
jgi:putative intracellular protease/amidase